MDIITKAELAKELGISKSRVSQYVRSGMPVLPDGRVERVKALNYLRMFRTSASGSQKGPIRAGKLLRGEPVQDAVERPSRHVPYQLRWSEADRCSVEVLEALIGRTKPVIAACALEAGFTVEQAFAFVEVLQMEVRGASDRVLTERRVPGWGRSDVGMGVGGSEAEPDWHTLAEAAGLSFDADACRSHLASLPWSRDQSLTGIGDPDLDPEPDAQP